MTKIKATLAILAALLTVACNHQASAPGSISPTNTAQSTPATHFSLELLGKRPTDPRTTLALRKALENGFDPDTTNADGIRAIHYAARGGRTDWINLLARHGADLNAPVDDPDNQSQPHHYACRNLDENTLLSLIRNGADCSRPNARTHRGCFQIAVANNTPQIIDFLVQHQCGNIDASTPTTSSPLRSAITKQLYAFADALLDAGADPVSLNDFGETAHQSWHPGNLSHPTYRRLRRLTYQLYPQSRPPFSTAINEDYPTAKLYYDVITSPNGTDLLRKALSEGFDPNTPNPISTGLLFAHYASHPTNPRLDWIPLLAEYNADLNHHSKSEHQSDTPSNYACSINQPQILLQLIKQGADCSLPDLLGNSCLHRAIHAISDPDFEYTHNERIAAVLPVALEHQCGSVNGPNNLGFTPLSIATARSHSKAVQMLLDAGADPTIPNPQGNLPIDTWHVNPHGPVYDRLKALTEERLAAAAATRK